MGPDTLGRYQLIRHLATGGMARVYLARATGPGGFSRHVVLKALTATRRDDAQYVSMFLDEARLVGTLHHQHIAQVFELGRADDGTYFLAMEYIHGETVRSVLEAAATRGMKLPLDLGLSIVCAAAAGLHHAHERFDIDGTPLGIVHRDVSPSNLILGFDGSIKLIDFGIAKAESRATHTPSGFIKGKTGYMAPEQARGYKVDRRSDVFALGVLAYELTTQERAFHSDSQFETMRRTLHGEVTPPSQIVPGYPPALEHVIMTALEVDPDERYRDAAAMRRALEGIARDSGLTLGETPVIRVLTDLFQGRPEPWLERAATTQESEATMRFLTDSGPMVLVDPPDPAPVRLARGTIEPPLLDPAPLLGDIDPVDLTTRPFEREEPPARAASSTVSLRPARTAVPPPVPQRAVTKPIAAIAAPPAAAASVAAPAVQPALPLPAPEVVTPLPPPEVVTLPQPRSSTMVVPSRPFARSPRFSTLEERLRRRWRIAIVGTVLTVVAGIALAVILRPTDDLVPPAPPPVAIPAPAPVPPPAPPSPAPAPARTPAPPTAPTPPSTVTLHVTTDPSGATVVLDGVRLGVTPFDAQVPAKGQAWLKVRMRNYIAVKTRVSLDQDVQWDVPLRPLSH